MNNLAARYRPLLRVAAWFAVGITLLFALVPHPPHVFHWDKADHGLAFVSLGLAFSFAYPTIHWLWIAAGLLAFGGAIELLQGLTFIHRDSDVMDWLADAVAILGAIGLFKLVVRSLSRSPAA